LLEGKFLTFSLYANLTTCNIEGLEFLDNGNKNNNIFYSSQYLARRYFSELTC
jgi:hypothetical protein